jgi:hypothetical protein
MPDGTFTSQLLKTSCERCKSETVIVPHIEKKSNNSFLKTLSLLLVLTDIVLFFIVEKPHGAA